jgi:hypothetical protein
MIKDGRAVHKRLRVTLAPQKRGNGMPANWTTEAAGYKVENIRSMEASHSELLHRSVQVNQLVLI